MSSNYPDLIFNEDEDFTADRLNRAMEVLDQRLRSLEPFSPSWEAAVNDLRSVGLSRLNDAILPAYNRIQLLSRLGFLFAGSLTSLTLVQNQSSTFTIEDETERSLFTPTPFLAIVRRSTTDDYAIAQLVSYDNASGRLVVLVKAITGNAGPHSDWQIGALAANTMAAMGYFTQIDAARAATLAAKAVSDTNATQTALDRAQTGLDAASALASKIAAATSAANAALWDPTSYSTTAQVKTAITAAVNGLVNGAPAAMDTLKELADVIGDNANFAGSIIASLGNRIRFDAAQTLAAPQLTQAQSNIGLARCTAAEIQGNTADNVLTTSKAWDAAKWVNLGNVAGAVVINGGNGSRFYGTLTGNLTVSFSNVKDGQPIELILQQDGTGSRTVSWSGVTFPDATAPTVTTNAGYIACCFSGVGTPYGWLMGAGWKIN